VQGGLCGFSRVTVPPSGPCQPPANLGVWAERVSRPRGHDPGVAEKFALRSFNGPAAKAVLVERGNVAVELRIAPLPVERTPGVEHYLRVRVQSGKCMPVGVFPATEPCARRLDHLERA
jgi:hypothetical protein